MIGPMLRSNIGAWGYERDTCRKLIHIKLVKTKSRFMLGICDKSHIRPLVGHPMD